MKIVKIEDLKYDVGWVAKRCSMFQKALLLALGALASFSIGLAIAQAGPGGGGGSIRPVPLSEIQKEATIPVARGVTLDFSDGGANNVTVQTSDNPSVVLITSKTNAATVAPGMAHLKVANYGQCPKPTGAQIILCDPVPIFSVTINVQNQP